MKRQIQNFASANKSASAAVFATSFAFALGIVPTDVTAHTYAQQQSGGYQAQDGDAATRNSASNPMAGERAVTQDFSDQQLKSFAAAQKNVDEARVKMASKLQSTQDPQEAASVREEANEEMLAAVENAGLTRDEYNNIARAVALDPAIATKVDRYR